MHNLPLPSHLFVTRRFDEAIEHFRAALALQPEFHQAVEEVVDAVGGEPWSFLGVDGEAGEVTELFPSRPCPAPPGRFGVSGRLLADEARAAADAADAATLAGDAVGRFHGVPCTVKENIDVAGTHTTNGVIALAEATTNLALVGSEIEMRVRIVETYEPKYAETGHSTVDLHYLTDPDDDELDEIDIEVSVLLRALSRAADQNIRDEPGTGLGLSMSYDIISKGHGGDIQMQTEEGGGTVFTIKLPMGGQ